MASRDEQKLERLKVLSRVTMVILFGDIVFSLYPGTSPLFNRQAWYAPAVAILSILILVVTAGVNTWCAFLLRQRKANHN